MRSTSLLKATAFVVIASLMVIATGPLIGMLGAMTGVSVNSVWLYAALFSAQLLIGTALALRLDGDGLDNLGLIPTVPRIREFTFGFAVGAVLFCALALVRGATIGAAWTFTGPNAILAACTGLGAALLLMLPEELLFRGYAFQRLVRAVGIWPGILISATLFGI
jgi:membrane protease YdiL (CAAX protease family)